MFAEFNQFFLGNRSAGPKGDESADFLSQFPVGNWERKSAKTSAKMSDVYAPIDFAMSKGAHDKRPKNPKEPKV